MEKNKYKDINKYIKLSTERLYNLLKIDISSLKTYCHNNKFLRQDELEDLVYEIESINHVIKVRLYNIK